MKGSIIITAFFIAGIVCAQTGMLPLGIIDDNWSFYALCLLMFCVGMSVGNDSDITRQFCGIDPLLLMLPLVTIAGTLSSPTGSVATCSTFSAGFSTGTIAKENALTGFPTLL